MQPENKIRPPALKFAGIFTIECFEKKGGKLLWKKTAKNGTTNVGLNYALDIIFGAEAKPSWYVGLIRDDNYTGLAAGDTMASHGGWEEADEYSETERQEISFAAASGQAISSSSRCYFSINATETMKGVFLVNNSTKGGSTGTLFCTALFTGGDEAVVDGNVIKVTYTLTAAAA